MRLHFFLTVTLVLFFSLAVNAFSATYYVATTGNNGNPGTEAHPWATLSYAASNISSGDKVIVRGGTYKEDFTIGTANVTFQNHSDETPIIDGQDTIPSSSWGNLVTITGNQVTLDGFEVKRSNGRGIMVNGGDYVTIKNCHIHNCYRQGIFFYESADHCVAEGNTVHNTAEEWLDPGYNNWSGGIAGRHCYNLTIKRNTIYNSWGEGLSVYGQSADCVFEYNVVYNNRAVEIYLNECKNIVVRHNIIYGVSDTTYWRGGAPSAGIIINNESSSAFPAGYDGGHKIYGNLVAYCGSNLDVWSGQPGNFKDIKVYNNTFVEGHGRSINIGSNISNWEFKNNIIWQTNGTIGRVPSSGITVDYNLWSREPENNAKGQHDPAYAAPKLAKTSGWNSLRGGDIDGSEFALQSTSPAKDAGTPLGAEFDDIAECNKSVWPAQIVLMDQDKQGSGWEIGADVHVGNPTALDPPTNLKIATGP